MLKVAQIIPTLDRSGAEKQMVLLARGLPRDRFHVEVAALTRLGPFEADLKAAGVPVTLIGKRGKADPFALGRLTRFLKDGRFDVVQTWIFAANTYGRLAARRARVPVIVTAEMAVDLWKGKAERLIDRWLAGVTDRVVGNSKAVVDFYEKQVGVPPDRLACIYSGIDDVEPPQVDRAKVRAEFGWPTDGPLALFAGRLYPQKGVEDLLQALDVLQHVRSDLRTLIVGDGPLRERLERHARSYEVLDRTVKFTGHRDDVPRLLAAADFLVLPSLFEGLPNVVLEAMRFRKAVVATAAPGTTELVVDGETGLLVPIRDATKLCEAIRRVVDDPALACQLGEAGRARVEAHFRVDAMVEQFATLYEELARAKARGPR
jgi:glycosyltransferase involved in cell wall biosynthesis